MIHARNDYNRIQDPAIEDPLLLAKGCSPIAEDEPVFLIRAKDQAFTAALIAWIAAHERMGGDSNMSRAVNRHITRALEWRRANGIDAKVADAPDEVFTD